MRAVLYARYSSEKQRETSIVDQLRHARARAEAEGWTIIATHTDESVSGSTPIALRAGGKALLADALATRFDVLVVEGLDRLSRELGEAEQLVKRLEHRGIRIIGTSDGYDTEAKGRKVMRIARGLVNELYLDDLREKTHRGLAGQFDRGFSAGGRSYGYRSVPAPDGRGHVPAIDEVEAAIVRRIFQEFADGHAMRWIVHRLNSEGVPSARGGTWAVSALVGTTGMLGNELYIGRVLWNRRQWLKDPDTGKRRSVERPRSEWQERLAPALRIVSDELWRAAQDRGRSGPARGTRTGKGASPRTLFGAGMLRCYLCNGAIVGVNADRYGCSIHKDRGNAVCANTRTVARDLLDRRLLAELREELLTPGTVRDVRAAVAKMIGDAARLADSSQATWRRRAAEIEGEITRLVDAIATVGLSPALQQRLAAAELERRTLERDHGARPVLNADQVMTNYRALILRLQDALTEGGDLFHTRAVLAEMLGSVVIGWDEGAGASYAEMEEPAERLLLQALGGSLGMVAGARNPSRRLWL
jgi:site-specific DNA recombinase